MSYRVDTLPWALKPVLFLYGYGLGLGLFAYYAIQRLTLTVKIDGRRHVSPEANYIFCHWHGAVPLAFQCSVPRMPGPMGARPHAWMQHPLWYMKPIHVLLRLIGVRRIVLGSSGHDGRRAAEELAALLRAGYSTVILPDGPAGPRRVLKRGVLHLAAETGIEIVPLRLGASRSITVRSWDRKRLPVPLSTVRLQIGQPIRVSPSTLEHAEALLASALG